MTLIEISRPTAAENDSVLADIASRGIELPKSLLIASSDARPAPVEIDENAQEDDELVQAAGDTQGHAVMFGKYMGQVSARIERAWIRPRTPIGSAKFDCETKIEQDRTGSVLSVELRKCNGNVRWQRSLVAAIERASPLSAPPEPSVFANTLVLSFSASEFVDGQSVDGEYEPVTQLRAAMADAVPKTIVSDPSKTLRDMSQYKGNIELTISGKDTTWTLHEPAEQSSGRNDNKKTSAASKWALDSATGFNDKYTGRAQPH